MKTITYLITFALFSSCNRITLNKCVKYGSNENINKVLFYSKSLIEINGHRSYDVNLVVTNYQNGSRTVKDFVEMAENYIDTSKEDDSPVGSISFLGQKKDGCIPDNYNNEKIIFSYSIITFNYLSLTQKVDKNQKTKISSFHFWKNGKSRNSVNYDLERKLFDSIMNSNPIIKN